MYIDIKKELNNELEYLDYINTRIENVVPIFTFPNSEYIYIYNRKILPIIKCEGKRIYEFI